MEKGNHSNAENINWEDLMLENPIKEIILIKSELKLFVKKGNHSNAENINCEDLMLENPIRGIILIKSELKQFVKKKITQTLKI